MPRPDRSVANCPTSIAAQCRAGHNDSPNSPAGCWTKALKIRRSQTAGACFFPAGLPSAPAGEPSWPAGCRQSLSLLRQCRKRRSICGVATLTADWRQLTLREIHLMQTRDAWNSANGTRRNPFGVPQICKDSPALQGQAITKGCL